MAMSAMFFFANAAAIGAAMVRMDWGSSGVTGLSSER